MKSGTVSAIVSSDPEGTVALMETLSSRSSASRYKHLYKLDVRVNERSIDTHQYSYRKRVTYFPSGYAILPPKSTVREALTFHAMMGRMSERSSKRIVDKILTNLKLTEKADRLIQELSLTERARARVGLALVSRPAALLLDLPLFGLDVYEAFQTITVLKQVAVDLNIAVLISVTQPSSEVLFALDKVTFLSKGSVIYSGRPDGVVHYFYQLGYSCPPSYSPSDFLLFLVEVVPPEEHDRLVSSWQWHVGNALDMEQQMMNEDDVDDEIDKGVANISTVTFGDGEAPPMTENLDRFRSAAGFTDLVSIDAQSTARVKKDTKTLSFFGEQKRGWNSSNRVSFFKQFLLLYKRELLFLRRSWGAFLVRFSLLAILCGLISLLIYQIGTEARTSILNPGSTPAADIETHMNNYYGAIAVMVILALFGQVEGISVAIPSIRLLFLAENSFANFYGLIVFFLTQFLVELPLLLLHAVTQVSIAFWTVGFAGSYIQWVGIVFCTAVATNSVGWVISCVSRNPLVALQLIPVVILPQLLFSGLLTDVELIPTWLRWMEYLCYLKYCINLAFLIEVDPYMKMTPVPTPVQNLADQNSINPDNVGPYVSLVVLIIVGCRMMAAFAIVFFRKRRYLKL